MVRLDTPIEELELSVRTYNCLKRGGFGTVRSLLDSSDEQILSIRNFGRRCHDELMDKLATGGFLGGNEVSGWGGEDGAGLPVGPRYPSYFPPMAVAQEKPQPDDLTMRVVDSPIVEVLWNAKSDSGEDEA